MAAKRTPKQGAGKPAPHWADVVRHMTTWPRAPDHENGGIQLLYEFLQATDPDFPSDDRARQGQLIEEVHYAFKRYLDHEATTLDEAFNVKRRAKYRRAPAKKVRDKKHALQVDGRILFNAGAVVGPALNEVLADIHGIDKTTAGTWYGEFNKNLPERPPPAEATLPDRFIQYIDALEWMKGYEHKSPKG